MKTQFVMIAYVNRSGSTLLSRMLSERFREAFVFPELSFPMHLLIEHSRQRFFSGQHLFDMISDDPRIDTLGIDDAELLGICNRSTSQDMGALLVRIAEAVGGGGPYRAIFFKLEPLLYMHGSVAAALPGLKTIHLVRDPRAVVCSMIQTPVPEKPGFNMARGSIIFAAKHWKRYVRRAIAVSTTAPLLTIFYEELNDGASSCFSRISSFIAIDQLDAIDGITCYRISKTDSALHQNIFQPFVSARMNAWMTELKPTEIKLIEYLCGNEIPLMGYREVNNYGTIDRAGLIVQYIFHYRAILFHVFHTTLGYARREDRLQAIGRRLKVLYKTRG